MFQNYGYTSNNLPPYSEDITPFVEGLNAAVIRAQPEANFDAYLNYVDPSLSAEEAHKEYYGPDLYAQLLRIKRKVDPKQVFWNPQAIGVGDADGYGYGY